MLELKVRVSIILQVTITTVIQAYNTKKIIEDSETNNIIQHNNNILVLWKAHIL